MSKRSPNFISEGKAWMAALRAKGYSVKTEATYLCALRNFRLFLAKRSITRPSLVTAACLVDWQRHLVSTGCAAVTVEAFTKIVRRWFAWQVTRGRLFTSPAQGLTSPRVVHSMGRCPSEEDMRRLLGSVSRGRDRFSVRDRAILEIAYATGARLAELARLDLSALNLRERTVRLFGKGNWERVAPLTRTAVTAIRTYLRRSRPRFLRSVRDQPALFVGLRGSRRMATPAIFNVVRSRGRQIGLVITPHDIRRAFATHLLLGGAHPTALKELLGHQTYRHLHHYLNPHSLDVLATARNSKVSR